MSAYRVYLETTLPRFPRQTFYVNGIDRQDALTRARQLAHALGYTVRSWDVANVECALTPELTPRERIWRRSWGRT